VYDFNFCSKGQFEISVLNRHFANVFSGADDVAILQDIALLFLQPETNNNRKYPHNPETPRKRGSFCSLF
jgi:hypothetical protein